MNELIEKSASVFTSSTRDIIVTIVSNIVSERNELNGICLASFDGLAPDVRRDHEQRCLTKLRTVLYSLKQAKLVVSVSNGKHEFIIFVPALIHCLNDDGTVDKECIEKDIVVAFIEKHGIDAKTVVNAITDALEDPRYAKLKRVENEIVEALSTFALPSSHSNIIYETVVEKLDELEKHICRNDEECPEELEDVIDELREGVEKLMHVLRFENLLLLWFASLLRTSNKNVVVRIEEQRKVFEERFLTCSRIRGAERCINELHLLKLLNAVEKTMKIDLLIESSIEKFVEGIKLKHVKSIARAALREWFRQNVPWFAGNELVDLPHFETSIAKILGKKS